MANVARLGVVMGLDTAEFSAGIEAVSKKLEDFKSKLLELGSLAAFSEMTAKAMEFADSIVKTAKANDVTTASVLELSKALEENGGSAEETSRIYSGFNQKVETAALGSAKAQESFARLGVSLKDLATLSSQALFEKTIQGLAKIEDSVTRNGLAFQVLGKSAKGVDIKGLAATLEEAKGEFDNYSESVNKAHELHLRLEASGRMITLAFTNAFIPTLDAVRKALEGTTKDGGGVVGMITDVINVLGVLFRYTSTTIVIFVDTIKLAGQTIKESWEALFSGSTDKLNKLFNDYNAKSKAMVEADAKFSEDLLNPKKGVTKPEDDPAVQRDIILANAKKVESAKYLTEEYKKQADLQYATIEAQRKLLDLTKDQAVVQQAVNKVIEANEKAIDAIDKQIASARGQGAGGATLITELEKQKKAILGLKDAEVARTKQGIQDTIDYQRTFSFGWNKAWNQYKEDANNNAKITSDIFNSVMGSMNSALDKFVETGKLSFKDFANSVIQDIEKIILKAMVAKTMTAAFGGTAFGGLLGFANGGEPPVGVPSIVGENGPELFVPNRSGTIIPNNQLSSALGGGSSGPTYNGPYIASMSAIDTQSAVQFLARNKTAVWSANQSAQRGLPTSR